MPNVSPGAIVSETLSRRVLCVYLSMETVLLTPALPIVVPLHNQAYAASPHDGNQRIRHKLELRG